MAWVDALSGLMADTVRVTPLSGLSTDGYGTPTYGTASTYTARISREQKLVRTLEGTEETATAQVWVKSTSTFDPATRFELPTSTGGWTAEPLMAVEAYPDEDGVAFVKLYFGG